MNIYYGIKKKTLLLFIMVVIAGLITACSGKTDNIKKQIDDMETGTLSGGQNLKVLLGVEDEWTETIETDSEAQDHTEVKISAKVETPNTDEMPVIILKEDPFTDEKKQQILETVCDKESICDEETTEAVEARIARYDSIISFWEQKQQAYIEENGKEDVAAALKIMGLYSEREVLVDTLKNMPKERHQPDYTLYSFYGTIDGRWFWFDFNDSRVSAGLLDDRDRAVSFSLPNDMYYDEILADDESAEENAQTENACQFSVSQAEKLADDLLGKLGYDTYLLANEQSIRWVASKDVEYDAEMVSYTSEAVWTTLGDCGWHLTYGRNVNQAASDTSDYSTVLSNAGVWQGYGLECAIVEVDNVGISAFSIAYPYKQEGVLEEHTTLLDFAQIKEVFRSIISSRADSYLQTNTDSLCFDHMELVYFRCMAEDGRYKLIPVWKLYYMEKPVIMEKGSSIAEVYMVNALDGKEISVVDELGETG